MTEIIEKERTPAEIADSAAWEAGAYEREYAAVERARQNAYQQEADPIFFQSQRGKKTKQEWLDKVAEIDARLPYPVKETPTKGK